jgi:hypothetical protein
MSGDYLWNPSSEPDAEIVALEDALRGYRFQPRALRVFSTGKRRIRVAVAAAVVVMASAAGSITWRLTRPEPWSVEAIAGLPLVKDGHGNITRTLRAGAQVETDARSVARVAVGRIGIADLEPGSLMNVVRDDEGQHRLSLRRGTLNARIWARPRFFVVETPSALAVDLGCAYSLRVDSTGSGILAVSYGEVELSGSGRVSLLVAGAAASMDSTGPGIPYPVASSIGFQRAVQRANRGTLDAASLDVVLREATAQGTITLWHLLPHVDVRERAALYDRLLEFAPPPKGVARIDVLRLEPAALNAWKEALRPMWSSESSSSWRRLLVRLGIVKPVALLQVRSAVHHRDVGG